MTTNPPSTTSKTDPYYRLIEEMPRIAEVVNAFSSEVVQKSAYDSLITAIGAPVAPVLHAIEKVAPPVSEKIDSPESTDEEQKGRRRGRSGGTKKTFTPTKGLNFAPAGKPKLTDFVAEKAPHNQHERNLLACYYLSEMMGVENVDTNHVLAVFRAAGWPASKAPDVSLRVTAHKTSWIDTSVSSSVKVMWSGDEHIVSKMPSQAKKDAA